MKDEGVERGMLSDPMGQAAEGQNLFWNFCDDRDKSGKQHAPMNESGFCHSYKQEQGYDFGDLQLSPPSHELHLPIS